MLEGKVQIYLPDFKYALSAPAAAYSHAADYPAAAKQAILEMFRQVGPYDWTRPGGCKRVCSSGIWCSQGIWTTPSGSSIGWREQFAPGEVLFSLMSQYTPCRETGFMELQRTLTPEEYDEAFGNTSLPRGLRTGFMQDLSSATAEAIPAFDGTGVEV